MDSMDNRRPSSTVSRRMPIRTISKVCSVTVSPYDTPLPKSETNNVMDPNHHKLRQWLRPFFVSLCVLGLAHERNLQDHRRYSPRQTFFFVHSVIVNVLLWGNCARLLTLFQNVSMSLDWILVAKLTVLAYNAHCALSASIVFYTFTNKTYLRSYLEKWKVDFQDAYADIGPYEKSLKHAVVIVTGACWFLFLGQSLATLYAFLFTPLYNLAMVPFTPDHPHTLTIKIVIFLLFTFRTSASGVFAHGMVVLFSLQVSKMCDFHRDKFCENIDANGKFIGNIEEYRRKHNSMSRLIINADRFMAMHNSETFILMIALICLVMYGLIYYPETRANPAVTLMSIWYVATFTTYLAVVCVASAYVNSKAHCLYDHLHSINLDGESLEHISQVCGPAYESLYNINCNVHVVSAYTQKAIVNMTNNILIIHLHLT